MLSSGKQTIDALGAQMKYLVYNFFKKWLACYEVVGALPKALNATIDFVKSI